MDRLWIYILSWELGLEWDRQLEIIVVPHVHSKNKVCALFEENKVH